MVSIKFGKLLKQFGYDDETCKQLSALLGTELELLRGATLSITKTSEEVLNLYNSVGSGTNSCMTNHKSVAAYCTDDVAVAYVMVNGRLKARAVINKRDKTFAKIYGNSSLLRLLLEREGYTAYDTDGYLFLEGCKLLKIGDDIGTLCPYIDCASNVFVEDDYLVVSVDGDHEAQICGEYLEDVGYCERCDSYQSAGDMHYSEHGDASMCTDCFDAVHVQIGGCSYHKKSAEVVELHNGEYALLEGAKFVESEGEYYLSDDVVYSYQEDQDYVMDKAVSAIYNESGDEDYFLIEDTKWHNGSVYLESYLDVLLLAEEEEEDE